MKRILVMTIENAGVAKYRFDDPHIALQTKYPNDFYIDIIEKANITDEKLIKDYDAIFAQSSILMSENIEKLIKHIQSMGIKFIVDMDDYWELPLDHPLKKRFDWEARVDRQELEITKHPKKDPKGELRKNIEETRKNNRLVKGGSVNRMLSNIKIVDAIITTTEYLAKEIKRYNSNVYVIPNAVDHTEKQFIPTPMNNSHGKIRIGWAGGSSHLQDLNILAGLPAKLSSDNINYQMIMCGFDNRVKNISTGKIVEADFKSIIGRIMGEFKGNLGLALKSGLEYPTWVECEKRFTNNYQLSDKSYEYYLQLYRKFDYDLGTEDKKYKRVWSKPIQTYAEVYNEFDIALAPLVNSKFNQMKSQLKLLESGFHKKPLICSEVAPYKIDGVNGKNCLLINENDKMLGWYRAIKKLVLEPNLREDLGNSLNETVMSKYTLDIVSDKRAEIYKKII